MTATFPDADGPFRHERCLCCAAANPHSMGLHLWPIREDGRRCLVAGELRTGDTLPAGATGLFVQPRPGHYGDAEAAVGRW